MSYLLSISPEQYGEKLSFSESLEFGGQMILLGMGAVFSVLAIIWLILTIFKLVFTNINAKEKKEAPVAEPAPVQVAQAVTSDDEIVAVIAAAIAMAESECGDNVKFRVVSFKRK